MYSSNEYGDPTARYENQRPPQKQENLPCTPAFINMILQSNSLYTFYNESDKQEYTCTEPTKIYFQRPKQPYFAYSDIAFGKDLFVKHVRKYCKLAPYVMDDIANSIRTSLEKLPFDISGSTSSLKIDQWLDTSHLISKDEAAKIRAHFIDPRSWVITPSGLKQKGTLYTYLNPPKILVAKPESISLVYNDYFIQFFNDNNHGFLIEYIIPRDRMFHTPFKISEKAYPSGIVQNTSSQNTANFSFSNPLGQKLIFHNNTLSLQNPSSPVDTQEDAK
jgi:hypothetical protein